MVRPLTIIAKYIPDSIRLMPYIFILIIIRLSVYPCASVQGAETRIFYVRVDVKYSDNSFKKANLIMIPGGNDYRPEKFTYVLTSGTADFSQNNPQLSIETLAEHNAIQCLLEQHGLKSIKSKSTTFNNSNHNEIIISYEGAVKLPWKIIKKKFDKKNKLCTIKIKIAFAPIAFPDKWPMLKLKYKMRQLFNDFILLFK